MLLLTRGQISIVSSTKKHDPTYRLAITITNTITGGEPEKMEISRSFSKWFDETGVFVPTPLQEFLATSVPVIGKRDPKRVKTESQNILDANPELLDAVVAANSTGAAAEPADKKGSKRRKA